MFTKEEILIGIFWWAWGGFMYIAIAQPNVRKKKKAIFHAIASGPFCWLIIGGFGIKYYLEGLLNDRNKSSN